VTIQRRNEEGYEEEASTNVFLKRIGLGVVVSGQVLLEVVRSRTPDNMRASLSFQPTERFN